MNVNDLITFWFANPHLWFDASEEDDHIICMRFAKLFDERKSEDDMENPLGSILLYDQIGRHICRVRKLDHTSYFQRIFPIATSIIENRDILETYKPEERVFILLVYRHTFQVTYIEKVISIIQEWRLQDNLPIYRRFYQASLNSLAKLKNKENMIYEPDSDAYSNHMIDQVLDKDHSPKMNDFYDTIDFLSFPKRDLQVYEEPLYKIYEENLLAYIAAHPHITQIGVSVSGGVDSMVCTYLLNALFKKHTSITSITPIAFSINYGNRIEQNIELFMVNCVIQHISGNSIFPHYVREITEMKRTQDHDRDLYEEFTRNIRFDCYKIIGQQNSGFTPFILGHNRDDSLENVISNIKKERSYQNLFGMTSVGTEKGITLLRPLLSVWKRDIVAFAQKYKIPFVYDSTPSWSERGQMRDILFPFLNQFDSRILDGLFSLASNYKEIYKVYESSLPHIHFESNQCIVEYNNIYFEDYLKRILQKIIQYYGLHPVRNKAIHHLSQLLHCANANTSTHKITLSKQLSCMKSNQVLIFYIKK
jgi:tRNA(Ile)-lysidine synthetase-like protein